MGLNSREGPPVAPCAELTADFQKEGRTQRIKERKRKTYR